MLTVLGLTEVPMVVPSLVMLGLLSVRLTLPQGMGRGRFGVARSGYTGCAMSSQIPLDAADRADSPRLDAFRDDGMLARQFDRMAVSEARDPGS
jgi:hypothetical protein